MNRSDRLVLIAGAGFSAANGLPLMSSFADYAHRLYFEHKADEWDQLMLKSYEEMFDFRGECEQSAGAFLRDWENIEELYTQADLRRLAGIPDKKASAQICRSIAWVIWDVYRRGIPESRSQHPMRHLASALASFQNNSGLLTSIVTTNYDLVIENAIAPERQFHYPGFRPLGNSYSGQLECTREAEEGFAYDPSSVEIIKLHGSVNWFDLGDLHLCSRMVTNDSSRKGVAWPGNSQGRVGPLVATSKTDVSWQDAVPAIIPPMLGKAAVTELVSKQWRAAIRALRAARHVVIIGYSFPETDTFMTRLLAEAIHRNDNLHSMFIVDPSPTELWKQKCARMFAPVFLGKKVAHVQATAVDGINSLNTGSVDNLWERRVR